MKKEGYCKSPTRGNQSPYCKAYLKHRQYSFAALPIRTYQHFVWYAAADTWSALHAVYVNTVQITLYVGDNREAASALPDSVEGRSIPPRLPLLKPSSFALYDELFSKVLSTRFFSRVLRIREVLRKTKVNLLTSMQILKSTNSSNISPPG